MNPEKKCDHCGSDQIVANIRINDGAGLCYKIDWSWILTNVEPLLADLCSECGSVRLHVRTTDRKWLTDNS